MRERWKDSETSEKSFNCEELLKKRFQSFAFCEGENLAEIRLSALPKKTRERTGRGGLADAPLSGTSLSLHFKSISGTSASASTSPPATMERKVEGVSDVDSSAHAQFALFYPVLLFNDEAESE